LNYQQLTIHICLRNLTCSWLSSAVHPEIVSGILAAAKHFESQGATVAFDFDQREEVQEMFQLVNAFRVWAALMSHHKHEPFSKTIRRGLSAVLFWPLEIVLSLFDLSKNTFPAVALAVLEWLSDLSFMEGENRAMRDMGERLKGALNEILRPKSQSEIGRSLPQEGVLFIPSLPTPAPFHSESLVRIFDTANTSFFNVMELPATAVPLGLTHHEGHARVPIGFQVSCPVLSTFAFLTFSRRLLVHLGEIESRSLWLKSWRSVVCVDGKSRQELTNQSHLSSSPRAPADSAPLLV
jgi:Asp-tRNA(Asn)/Glu-tRNA(Gln) amidotransferase A subunit family amidase